MKRLFCVLLLLLIAGCSTRAPQQGSTTPSSETKLTITGSPRQGFEPMRVTFRGLLEVPDENDKDHYCLQEEWDFGDGAKSTEKPNCDPHSSDTKIKTEFFTEHVYEKHGNYNVRLTLGDKKVRSRAISIVILERNTGPIN
ncbi:PKD domain-containing protein [bacterium]|nr:PKD domain-containing protein [bacterium]